MSLGPGVPAAARPAAPVNPERQAYRTPMWSDTEPCSAAFTTNTGSKGSPRKRLDVVFADYRCSIILSKAFLLAEDKAIKDPVILRQLGQ